MLLRDVAIRLALLTAGVCSLPLRDSCRAQQDPVSVPYETAQEASGCKPLAAFPALPMASVESCHNGDSVEVTLPMKPDASGLAQEKRIRGKYEFREYRVQQWDQDMAFDNLMGLAPMAGFRVKYSARPSTITARNGDTWILINVSTGSYTVSVVQEPPEVWTTARTAEEISHEMQSHNRVEIYGIVFSAADQSILEKQSPILFEILKYLKQNPQVSIIIESDKMSAQGPSEDDAEITRERANGVMDWLIAHGIARSHVQPRPAGRNNPVTENESPSEIQRNERIVLIRANS